MKAVVVLIASRVLDIGEPEEGQSKTDFIQCSKEHIDSYPDEFLDSPDAQVLVVLEEVPSNG